MDKEMFIAAHEELVDQYMIDHPEASWSEAYEATGDRVYDRYRDKWADYTDMIVDNIVIASAPPSKL